MWKRIVCLFLIFLSFSWFFLGSAHGDGTNKCKWTGCINSEKFVIPVWKLVGNKSLLWGEEKNTSQVINTVLGNIIQKLMIALGSFALIIMTVWGGYMILAHGQDELLSKWKSIFLSGIIALVVALSSYYLVSFIQFILYAGNSAN